MMEGLWLYTCGAISASMLWWAGLILYWIRKK